MEKQQDIHYMLAHGHKINKTLLTEEQLNHLNQHEKHKGHEAMHASMVLILLVGIVLAQFIIIFWKKRHIKSYNTFTMFAMWLVPFGISCYSHYTRFISIWLVLTILTTAIIFKPLREKKISGSLPRLIYRWFYYLYSISSVIAVTGYLIVLFTFFGLNLLIAAKPQTTLDIGFIMLFYGIYWGVLCRDFTDFLIDILAANIGYYSPSMGFPAKQLKSSTCAICGRSYEGFQDKNDDNNSLLHDSSSDEKTYTLSCGHRYHEYCIYGWCLVGKKQICPFCKEKVDTRKLFKSLPFQKPHFMYGNFLDFIRYLVAWQPLILIIIQGVNYYLGLE